MYVLSIGAWQTVPFPFFNQRVKWKWFYTVLRSEAQIKISVVETKMLNVYKST